VREKGRALKNALKRLRESDHRRSRFAYKALRSIYKPWQFVVDARFRSLIFLKYVGGADVHQVSNMTCENRYPELFLESTAILEDRPDLRIVSYGCSTGEEVRTLRKYFPQSYILGVDINRWNLVQCHAQAWDSKIHFAHSESPQWSSGAFFDMICCLSVLQRPENRDPRTTDSSAFYPFAKWNAKLVELDEHLAIGGLLLLADMDYRFDDCAVAEKYELLVEVPGSDRPVYSKSNRRLPKQEQLKANAQQILCKRQT